MSSQNCSTLVDETVGVIQEKKILVTLCEQGQKAWVQSVPVTRRVGRPRKTDIERLRVRTWYWKIKSLCPAGWTDATLDEKFGGQKGTGRLRIFDRMRKKGWFPRSFPDGQLLKNIKRPRDLVDAIDREFPSGGTKNLLESPFWTIFGKPTADLPSVRQALNECLDRNGLVRLESDLNETVDAQIREIIRNPDKRLSYISSAGIYTQWLFWEMRQIPDDFERLTLVGLLLRESLLLAYLDSANLLSNILRQTISQIAKAPWLAPVAEEFERVVSAYIHRGHIDASYESHLYEGDSRQAIRGYVVSKDSVFLGSPDNHNEKEAWFKELKFMSQWVAAMIRTGDGEWDMSDDKYYEESYQQWLKDREEPNIKWPNCPDDGSSRLSSQDEWPEFF